MPSLPKELCPFCAQPITREYGSFRCKNCARTSEDVIDLERRTRITEMRKAARAAKKPGGPAPASGSGNGKAERLRALAAAVERHTARKRVGPRG